MKTSHNVTSRRGLLVYASLGALGLLAAPGRSEEHPASPGSGNYQLIDQRRLTGGGVGLFIAVAPDPDPEQLRALGELLKEQFRAEPNVIVEVFDDAEAANTVRTGSRIVGEERFNAARARQKARYYKSAKPPRNEFIIYGERPETVRY